MTRQRLVVPMTAAVLVTGAFVIALVMPMYTCTDPYEFGESPGPGGGPTCAFTDMGYRPKSWLPTKITICAAGIVMAVAVILWSRRRRLLAIGFAVAFFAVTTAWFIVDA